MRLGVEWCRHAPERPLPLELERLLENYQVVLFPARRLAANGLVAWAQVRKAGYEGLVGKPTWAGGRSSG